MIASSFSPQSPPHFSFSAAAADLSLDVVSPRFFRPDLGRRDPGDLGATAQPEVCALLLHLTSLPFPSPIASCPLVVKNASSRHCVAPPAAVSDGSNIARFSIAYKNRDFS